MTASIRIGLLRLADSAPVLVAEHLGYFRRNGLDVSIRVEPSWSNIADGLAWNRLDAAVVFPPLAIMTALGRRGRPVALNPLMVLSKGGNTIVLRKSIMEAEPGGTPPRLAVVHPYSTHFLLLRRYLATKSETPDSFAQIVAMPPDTMLDALRDGGIDGFCAGPPWGAAAEHEGIGGIVAGSSSIWPGHVEKTLVTTRSWSVTNPSASELLINALRDAITFCNGIENRETLLRLLSAPIKEGGLALPAGATREILPGASNKDSMVFGGENAMALELMLDEMISLKWVNSVELSGLNFFEKQK
ncbi:nitrate/sulfonate/bicarbonate ABC transporter substrate-binding periplasmic protein [Acetobacter nitrogenifigens DSM 23921 = NBRC 105050]|uniref:Nitrate ABC transporter substrate-binding protein n=1 Tax=Acetobacter nitrogenifigens DSM 23921 = NBRC 105050 TaxID=1120919 RepID=A0A511X8T3_9PROT|nr:ABC transporter substrate-binding protein [Acetobacter nitrogenifigens]GBQ87424.1 nitrate/sulfonate/bicarbonate ABC transporter substrate-binding periplasmic protein [Acetobacter nitrogenifigens DSM 23921 = NBRC 105050]GEN59352.1 hypothetical protein ANI02nite_12360 [Acetobacter nitrogenifigens DSM 23921 = NBRC 105050]